MVFFIIYYIIWTLYVNSQCIENKRAYMTIANKYPYGKKSWWQLNIPGRALLSDFFYFSFNLEYVEYSPFPIGKIHCFFALTFDSA